jgi:hypothetical protein
MGEALEAGYDLAGAAVCFVVIALIALALVLTRAIAAAFDVSFLGVRPFHGVAVALHNTVISALDSALKGVEKQTAKFLSGLVDAFGMLIALPVLAIQGYKAAAEYLWHTAIPGLLASTLRPIRTTAANALGKAQALENELATATRAIEARIISAEKAAIGSAEAFAARELLAAEVALRREIHAAEAAAERYAELAVGRLRAAEEGAIAAAAGLAAEARDAGLAAAAAAEAAAERAAGSALAQSEAAAAQALAEAQAAGQAALDTVKGIAVGAAHDLEQIEGQLGALGVAGLIASIPAIATLVHAIATEAGLEDAACRAKVKGVCGTSPNSWGNMLAGLAALGIAFNLEELYRVARPLVNGLAGVIREAA